METNRKTLKWDENVKVAVRKRKANFVIEKEMPFFVKKIAGFHGNVKFTSPPPHSPF